MGTPSAATLSKGLTLLSAVAATEGRSTLSEVAARLGIPLATAHRLSRTLVSHGFLEPLRKGYFIAGPALRRQEGADCPGIAAASRLRGPLARLAKQHRAYAHFGVLDDGMVTYLVKESGDATTLFTEESGQLEAYCSGIGKVLLAALPADALAQYLASAPFVRLTANTLTDPETILDEVLRTARRGVGFDRHEAREDLFCIAVPVSNTTTTIGAVSLSLLGRVPDCAERSRIIRRLRAIARKAESSAIPPPDSLSKNSLEADGCGSTWTETRS